MYPLYKGAHPLKPLPWILYLINIRVHKLLDMDEARNDDQVYILLF
jgi:hypothetical protein